MPFAYASGLLQTTSWHRLYVGVHRCSCGYPPSPRGGPALWETLKVATFAIPQSHSVDCKAERVRPGRCGNDTPIVPSASWRRSKTIPPPKRSPYVSSKAGNQSFDCWNVWRSMSRHRKPPLVSPDFTCACEAAHPGTMICSNRLPLMVVDALRTGLHAAAPMRPANSHVKSPCTRVRSTVSVTTLVNGYVYILDGDRCGM